MHYDDREKAHRKGFPKGGSRKVLTRCDIGIDPEMIPRLLLAP